MADLLLNATSILVCAHNGRCVPVAVSPRVKVSGAPCLVAGTPMPIAGCTAGPSRGCTTAQVLTGSLRIRSMGQPVLTLTSMLLATPSELPVSIASPGQSLVKGG
jgi:hypothetical protein